MLVHLMARCTLAFCQSSLVVLPKKVPRTIEPDIPPSSGERPLQDEEVASSAIICKPIKAQAFNVSAVTRGLNSTAFVRTKGSFLMGKKKSSPCGRPDPFPVGSFPHLLQKFCTDHIGRHSRRTRHKQRTYETRTPDLRTQISAITKKDQAL